MKMEHNNKQEQPGRVKRLSDIIMTFAFIYSSFICFIEAKENWENNKIYATFIFFCGMLSFIAIFRWQIANLYNYLKKMKKR